MARPKHSIGDVVLKNYKFIHDYYERAIRSQKIFIPFEGQEKFQNIMLSANEKEEVLVPTLTNWIEKYISEDLWERCKTAIRQHKLMVVKKKKHDYKTFRIPINLFYDITFYAEKANLTKFEAMKQAIDIASKML
jgi:macrodomain Ter protein organizer (MatP/YcbG family)